MTRHASRLGAAFLLLLAGTHLAPAQSKSVEVPSYRQLAAEEAMSAPGNNGSDYSANAPSLSGLTLLVTIPAPAVPRLGYLIQAQCTAGVTVAFDDTAGALAPTLVVLAGPSSNGGQGGSISMNGMPHTGRIRIYSSASNCQMAARAW